MGFIIMGGSFCIGIIIGVLICGIYEFYTNIRRRAKCKEWYKRTEVFDQEIDEVNDRLKKQLK